MIGTTQKYILLLFCLLGMNAVNASAQQTIIKYLSGTDKDHTVTWDFYCTKGRNSGKWSTIQVPSCWELQGFGTYNYGGAKNASDEQGLYRYHFKADKQWRNKQVNIVFEGSMTDTKVKINGESAGKMHQGAFYRFTYDITPLLKFGKTNLLEVQVNKKSANHSVNMAERHGDFWIFGGIFRPVYLEVVPKTHISRLAIDAEANGAFSMEVFAAHVAGDYTVESSITMADGTRPLKPVSVSLHPGDTMVTLHEQCQGIKLWSPEFPHLYTVTVDLKNKQGTVIHAVKQKFGFRTAVLRPHDGFYLNGQKVLFKGVDHHSFWPSSGRTTSKALSIKDVGLMKGMNMNAVRASHYPPDTYFLDVCDSMGLMVLDELTGWQHYYDDSTGHRLVKEMVTHDVNHPSIVIWDNGNEGGFNRHLDHDFDRYDPQKRLVIHPWERFNGTNTKHYPSYNYMENASLYDNDVYFPTEFLHGLYDGGSGAGLDDYWNLMERAPHSAGGFIWNFSDGGVVRTDVHDSIDTHGDNAPDGILGPYRQIGGSFYAIKQIWSPVQIALDDIGSGFDGRLLVENRYLFTNLDQCTFKWKLVRFGDPNNKKTGTHVDDSGQVHPVSIKPGEKKWMDLGLPASWSSSDALYLTAFDPHHRALFTWSWPLHTPARLAGKWVKESVNTSAAPAIKATDDGGMLIVQDGDVELYFSKTSGYLEKVMRGSASLSLSGGPALAGFDQKLESFNYKAEDENYVVEAHYKGKDNWLHAKWTFMPGKPVKLTYSFSQRGASDFMGIVFNYPEKDITAMKWLGRGPFHVWKNRLKGLKFGIWENAYNNPHVDSSWVYPEYKGNHQDVYWVKVATREIPFTVFTENSHLFFQMLKPERPKGYTGRDQTLPRFPSGDIGFMNAIQPVGAKVRKAAVLGPESQQNLELNAPYKGVLWFEFR